MKILFLNAFKYPIRHISENFLAQIGRFVKLFMKKDKYVTYRDESLNMKCH